eukprot:946144-Prymnesium_polylepis.1
MNPASVGGGRTELPASLQALLTTVQLCALEHDEVRAIASSICATAFNAGAEGTAGVAAAQGARTLLDAALELNTCLPLAVPGA